MLIVALTGGAGFLSSFWLLHAGVEAMPLRYGLATGCAYLAFLFLLWLWLRTSPSDYEGLDEAITDLANSLPSKTGSNQSHYGSGGHFGGGGASNNWDGGASSDGLTTLPEVADCGDSANLLEAHEAGVPLALALALLTLLVMILFACVSVIYSAPTLFAELLVDGVMSVTLYRRLRQSSQRHWLNSAVRSTALPFAVAAALLMCAAFVMTHFVPDARTLGEGLAAL